MNKRQYHIYLLIVLVSFCMLALFSCTKNEEVNKEEVKKMEQEFKDFVKTYEAKMKPAYKDMSLAYWNASIVSNDENWANSAKMEMKVNEILSNKQDFAKLKKIFSSDLVKDSVLKRQLYVIYNTYLSKQIDTAKLNKLTKMQADVENKYSNFRAIVGTKKLSDNDVEEILKKSTDQNELKEVWINQKKIGPLVAQDLINIVKLRNEIAKELGFNNFHEMSLKLNDQDPKDVEKLFDELDNLTRDAFAKEKAKMDKILSERLKIKAEEMMPWDYQNRFFQEAPKIYNVDLDSYYTNIDIVKTAENFYQGIGLPIDDNVAKSDLFEKEKKNQHAYCINIDRDSKDIRVLGNIKQSSRWMETVLHEFGHSLYEKYLDQNLPWDLKTPAHTFTTEAIAMFFGRLASSPVWMKEMINIPETEAKKINEASFNTLKLQQLTFSRWSQVMYRFEKALYANPDQDLNKLWWDLVEKYQMLKRPENRNEPDWATKIHIATSPCYYHNYHLGELLASQLYFTLANKVLKVSDPDNMSLVQRKEVGKYLIDNIFMPGNRYYWDDMIERATGEKLTAKYYAKQFVK